VRNLSVWCGSQEFMDPHSSASTWPKVIHRSRPIGTTRSTAADTSGNSERSPVWNNSGSSASIKNWLNMKSASLTYVDSR
jgi:hypothetical protein